jgi:hypothetical protein
MAEPRVQFTLFRGAEGEGSGGSPRRAVQELWFSLARTPWSSLVLLPADEGLSVGGLALELADFGGRIRGAPATAIVADSMDYESARMIDDLQTRLRANTLHARSAQPAARGAEAGDAAPPGEGRLPAPETTVPAKVVIALQPVVVEPLGVSVALGADVVLLCVALRRTRARAARRTIELVGANRIAGALLT